MKEKTNNTNLVGKLKNMEGLLDIIEEDLENNEPLFAEFSNVIEILPDISQEWKLCQEDQVMTLYEMVDLCEQWVEDIAVSMITNNGKFGNKKLAKHVGENIQACRTVIKVTYHWLDSLNQ